MDGSGGLQESALYGAVKLFLERLAELRAVAEDAAGIMRRNVYGWFAREGRGVYRLSETGREAVTPDP